RNVQASCSRDTFAEEITEPGACRGLGRSPFGSGQDPDGGAALAVVGVAAWKGGGGGASGRAPRGAPAARRGSSSRCGLVSAVVTQLSSSAGGSSPGPGTRMVPTAGTGLPQVSQRPDRSTC